MNFCCHTVKLKCKENNFMRCESSCQKPYLTFVIPFGNRNNSFKQLSYINVKVINIQCNNKNNCKGCKQTRQYNFQTVVCNSFQCNFFRCVYNNRNLRFIFRNINQRLVFNITEYFRLVFFQFFWQKRHGFFKRFISIIMLGY